MTHQQDHQHTHHKRKIEEMDDAEVYKTRALRAQKRKKFLLKYGYRALVIAAALMVMLVASIIIFDL